MSRIHPPFAPPGSLPATPRMRSQVSLTIEAVVVPAAAGILMWLGWRSGVNVIVLLSFVLIAIWIWSLIGAWFHYRLRKLSVRRVVPEHLFAGRPADVQWEIRNLSRRGQLGLRIEDVCPIYQHRLFLPYLAGGGRLHKRARLRFPRRGRFMWPAVRIASGYPFGLFRRVVKMQTGEETVVLPQLGRLDRRQFRRLLHERIEPVLSRRPPARKHHASQNEFHSLREYRSGDSYRWIHWRTTARVGELMVREFAEPPLENLTVILDPTLADPPATIRAGKRVMLTSDPNYQADAELLESAIRLAAAICWEWCRHPGAVLALVIADAETPVQIIDTNRRRVFDLLRGLALVQGGPPGDMNQVAAKLRRTRLPGGPCVLVTPRAGEITQTVEHALASPMLTLDMSAGGLGGLYDPDTLPDGLGRTDDEPSLWAPNSGVCR